jgi:hypothetical protein
MPILNQLKKNTSIFRQIALTTMVMLKIKNQKLTTGMEVQVQGRCLLSKK